MVNLANSLDMPEAKNINQPSSVNTDLVLFTLTNSHSNLCSMVIVVVTETYPFLLLTCFTR